MRLGLQGRGQPAVQQQTGNPEHAIQHKHRTHGLQAAGIAAGGKQIRHACSQRADRRDQRANQTVARKQRGARLRTDGAGKQSLLKR